MGVYIKGMEIPKKCGQCKLYHAEYPMHCTAVEGHRTVGAPYGMPRPDWCPLVEIKEPHGRLIDTNKIEYENWYLEETGESYKMVGKDDIDEMSAIIEAEGSVE